MAQRNFTQFEFRQIPLSGDYLIGYKANATAEIRTNIQNIIDVVYSSEPRGSQGFSLVKQNSAIWNLSEETYTAVLENSATTWNYQGTDLKELSANWENTYLTVLNNANTIWNYQGTDLKELSANWQIAYDVATTYQSDSGNFVTNTILGSVVSLLTPLTLTETLTGNFVQSRPTLETPTTDISAIRNIVSLSQATYDALTVKLPTTLYVIV